MNDPRRVLDVLERHGVPISAGLRAEVQAVLGSVDPDAPTLRERPPNGATWSEQPTESMSPLAHLPGRYDVRGRLGSGGMGEVWQVHDSVLQRTVAMKLGRAGLTPAGRSRFLAEAQLTSQLEHPGIVPIYDQGDTPTGAPFYTMPILRGDTFGACIRALHEASGDGEWRTHPGGIGFQRLVGVFHTVADAIGYAHARGVVHRDLKPDNVMVGPFGETVVVDWGLAKVLGREEEDAPLATTRTSTESLGTLAGVIIGTPGYMPPEQALGEHHRVDRRADVHALGAMLWELLGGRAPYSAASQFDAVTLSLRGDPHPLVPPAPVPAELKELAAWCLQKEPGDRPADASVIARAVQDWLEGAHRRDRALADVAEADRLLAELQELRREADALERQARAGLTALRPYDPEEVKRGAWRLEDAALAARTRAELLEAERVERLGAALRVDGDLPEAHARLAEHHRIQHERAEQAGDDARAREHRLRLQAHDAGRRYTAYLDGAGAITVHTDPPGAEVMLFRYELRDRRLVAVPFGRLGPTPVDAAPLPMGSYRLDLRHPDRATVRYPVVVARAAHWDGLAPGESHPRPVLLPRHEHLGIDDVYIPAGWFEAGGDPAAEWRRPRQRVWLESFVLRRFPVTNREYLAFVNDHALDDAEQAWVPGGPGERRAYARDAKGVFRLQPDADGTFWQEDWPVVEVDWDAALAFAAWQSERDGNAWRLPWELEWEKAARGVDGRLYPWGTHFDASWCRSRESHAGTPAPAPVDSYPVDCGPHGARGLAANVHEWCLDVFDRAGPSTPAATWMPGNGEVERVARGGAWYAASRFSRAASRVLSRQRLREAMLGFRLARSFP